MFFPIITTILFVVSLLLLNGVSLLSSRFYDLITFTLLVISMVCVIVCFLVVCLIRPIEIDNTLLTCNCCPCCR